MKLRKNSVNHVLRGGSYDVGVNWFLRVTFRFRNLPVGRYWFGGFRFVVRGAVK
jgi:hypothetical protein